MGYRNLELKAPWGEHISSDITNLRDYFITRDGEDFLTIFNQALDKAKRLNTSIKICTL